MYICIRLCICICICMYVDAESKPVCKMPCGCNRALFRGGLRNQFQRVSGPPERCQSHVLNLCCQSCGSSWSHVTVRLVWSGSLIVVLCSWTTTQREMIWWETLNWAWSFWGFGPAVGLTVFFWRRFGFGDDFGHLLVFLCTCCWYPPREAPRAPPHLTLHLFCLSFCVLGCLLLVAGPKHNPQSCSYSWETVILDCTSRNDNSEETKQTEN